MSATAPALGGNPDVLNVRVIKLKRRRELEGESAFERLEKGFYEVHRAGDRYDFGPVDEWFWSEKGRCAFGLNPRERFFLLDLLHAINKTQSIPPVKDLAKTTGVTEPTVRKYLRGLESKIPVLHGVLLSPWLSADSRIAVLEALR